MILQIFTLVVFYLSQTVCYQNHLSDIIRVDYEGLSKAEQPQLRIVQNSDRDFKQVNIEGVCENCLQLAGNGTRLISIVSDRGDLVSPETGLILSMWVCGESDRDSTEVNILIQSRDQAGKNKTSVIGTCRLSGKKKTWLGAWYYRGDQSDVPMSAIIEITGKTKVIVDDILFTYTPKSLPVDIRPLLSIDRDRVMAGNEQITLQGVNLCAYSSEVKDSFSHEFTVTREDDYHDIAAAGFNTVRLNLWFRAMKKPGGWKWLDIHQLWARKHGLRLILDLHAPPGGYQSPMYKGDFWRSKPNSKKWRDQTLQFWKEVARRFHSDPTIAAIDLINEPKPLNDAQWWEFVRKAVAIVRAEGFRQPVIVENSFAKDSKFELLDDKGIIYDFHFYDPWFFASGESGKYNTACLPDEKGVVLNKSWLINNLEEEILYFARKNVVPVNIGEYGISDRALKNGGYSWLQDITDILNQNHIGRQYWCWHTYMDFALDRSGWYRNKPSEMNKHILSIISVIEQRKRRVAQTKGLVAFWDFETIKDGAWTSNYDEHVTDHSYTVYLKHIGDTSHYIQNNWPYDDRASRLQFDDGGPLGHAVYFNQGYIFGEVPRYLFANTPLDIHGRKPFTIVAWVKFIGKRHMVAGIWDEGGWNKYTGRRQVALFSGLFDSQSVIAHISATGAASFPQSEIDGAQYARQRAIDGKSFENGNWVAMAMTYDPGRKEVTAYLNGIMTPRYQTDPVANDVFRFEGEELSNPFYFKWPAYSPRNFILKYNGYNVEDTGIYEHWLEIDLNQNRVMYDVDYKENAEPDSRYKITLDILRRNVSLLSQPLKFEAIRGRSVAIPIDKKIQPSDVIITSLEEKKAGKWMPVGSEVRHTVTEGAPFTFGRALGLGSEVREDGTQLFIDGVAVFNRVLYEEELRDLSFIKQAKLSTE